MKISHIFLLSLGVFFGLSASHKIKESHRNNLKAQPLENFRELMKLGQCQTLFGTEFESSAFYRKCAFDALRNCGHEHPVIVGIVNKATDSDACSGFCTLPIDGKKYIFINFNEKYWDELSYGAVRFVMHHEASHLVLRDYNKTPNDRESRKIERKADKNAAIKVNCKRCVESAVKRYLKLHNQYYKDSKYYPKLTFKDLENMNQDTLNKMIDDIEVLSEKSGSTHPLHIERALRLYRYTLLLPEVKDHICHYHRQAQLLERLEELQAEDQKIKNMSCAEKLKRTVIAGLDQARSEKIQELKKYRDLVKELKNIDAIRTRDLERVLRRRRI